MDGEKTEQAIRKLEELRAKLESVKGDAAKTSEAINTFGSSKGLSSIFSDVSNLTREQGRLNTETKKEEEEFRKLNNIRNNELFKIKKDRIIKYYAV